MNTPDIHSCISNTGEHRYSTDKDIDTYIDYICLYRSYVKQTELNRD